MKPSPDDRSASHSPVEPLDAPNRELLANVRPDGWTNPEPDGVYDLVVIGAGTAGLVSAAGAAGLGARVALIERNMLGGDCLNVGCVPSKGVIRAARVVGEIARGERLGVHVTDHRVDFAQVMERMRRKRADISPNDSVERFAGLGISVFLGQARFESPRTVSVGGHTLRFRRAVIATGGRASAPPIPGLADGPHLTNETLFNLTERPSRLLVIGAGPIGCEMAQAFSRLGSEVTVVSLDPQVLPREDPDAAAIVGRQLERDGVRLELGAKLQRVDYGAQGTVTLRYERDGQPGEVTGDRLLVAVGRAPNLEGLNLEAAGVKFSRVGVTVDDRLQTANRRIYAAGDVCSVYKFTHAADAMARIVIQNALFFGRKRVSSLVIPWCTYTDPEVAHVGMYARDAQEKGVKLETLTIELSEVDRAILDEEAEGFVRVHHEGGRLLGCTIVAGHAGNMIGEASYVITHGGSLSDVSATIHPYPTQLEALKKAGDAYRRSLLTPTVRRWFDRYLRWTRR